MASKTTLYSANYLHCLPSDPNVRKEKINFIFNEDPDRISKNVVLCSLHSIVDLFKAQFDAADNEKDDAVSTILDPTVMSEHTSVTVFITWSLWIYLLNTECLCIFNLNHISVHLWRMQAVKHTQLLANHSCLLLSLRSTSPVQTEHWKQDRK